MADHAIDSNVFVYIGGQVPQHIKRSITHARIDASIDEIDERAFCNCRKLRHVEMHDDIRRIGKRAFMNCVVLIDIVRLPSVKIIDVEAFKGCREMKGVEFGNELELIRKLAFQECDSIKHIKFYAVTTIELCAFANCAALKSVTFPEEGIEFIQGRAFAECPSLRRIALPLKNNILANTVFDDCYELAKVVPVGSIVKTVSYLHFKSWRDAMKREIKSINRALPTLNDEGIQTYGIQQWIQSVLSHLEHYRSEHHVVVKEAMTILELALWKAKLDDVDDCWEGEMKTKRVKIDGEHSARQDRRVIAGTGIVIKNVLPFLRLG